MTALGKSRADLCDAIYGRVCSRPGVVFVSCGVILILPANHNWAPVRHCVDRDHSETLEEPVGACKTYPGPGRVPRLCPSSLPFRSTLNFPSRLTAIFLTHPVAQSQYLKDEL